VAYWTGTSAQSGSNNLFWDAANGRLGIGTNAPSSKLDIVSSSGGTTAGISVKNNGTGGSDYASCNLYNSNASILGQLFFTGTGYSISTLIGANGLGFYSNGSSGITIWSDNSSIKFQTGSGVGTSGSQRMTIFSTGNVGIGTGNSDSGERLQVTGDTLLKGSGATSGTFGLKVQNSALTNLFRVRNDGAVFVEAVNNVATLYMSSNGDSRIEKSTSGTNGMILYGPTSSHHTVSISSFNSDNYDNGALSSLRLNGNFIAASGSTAFSYMLLNGTINQTGTSTSIVRGLYINHTLTNSPNYRAIETARGNVVFGNLPTSSAGLPTGAIWNDAGTIKIV
jgi:hypothetical protein